VNLGADRVKNADPVSKMSAALESVIEAELGRDGREMPNVDKVQWTIERRDL
jgi:hypothetical protein